MTTLAKRLDTHFAACAAAAAGAAIVGGAQEANAAIVYSGLVNISIPNTFAGVYVNMVTGQTSGAGFLSQDFNPYFGGANMWMGGDGFNRAVTNNAPAAGAVQNLAPGTPIGGASTFGATAFPSMANFPIGSTGLMGLQFRDESVTAQRYGWIRITRNQDGSGTINDWAYENTGGGINAGEIPGPGSLALLALGALGLRGRKRN